MINEEKLIDLLFEGCESLVVKNGERFHLEDFIEYFNKPGLIVATIKGDSDLGIQQLPIGAVDNFRFMQVTNQDAIVNQEKNNGKSYDQLLKEYEVEKSGVLNQWKKMNRDKLTGLMSKYGNRFLGMDIVENKKKIEPKDEIKDEIKDNVKKQDDKNIQEPTQNSKPQITEDEINEGIGDYFKSIKNWFTDKKRKNELKNILVQAKKLGTVGVKELSKYLLQHYENDDCELFIKDSRGELCPIVLFGDSDISDSDISNTGKDSYTEKVNDTTLLLVFKTPKSSKGEEMTISKFDKVIKSLKIRKLTDIKHIVVMSVDNNNSNKLDKQGEDSSITNYQIVTGVDSSLSSEDKIVLTVEDTTVKDKQDNQNAKYNRDDLLKSRLKSFK